MRWSSRARAGKAMVSFLMEIIGLTSEEVDDLRSAPPAYDILSVLSATLPREARALMSVDLPKLASGVLFPSLFLLGEHSPVWANVSRGRLRKYCPFPRSQALKGSGMKLSMQPQIL
jgi:hypothetical protein